MRGSEDSIGLYVHIPFCEVKCTYCHFAIDPSRPPAERQERYLQALLAEIEKEPRQPRTRSISGAGRRPSLPSIACAAFSRE